MWAHTLQETVVLVKPASTPRHPATGTVLTYSLLTLAAGCLFLNTAHASGYNFGTQSASAQGAANANGAEANDASVIYANPAGMTRLKGTQTAIVLNVVAPKVDFQPASSTFGGTDGGDPVDPTFVPHGYITHQINDRFTAGIGVFVPFGAKVDYSDDFVGRYYGKQTELETININPSLAFKLAPQHSIGFGLDLQYMKAKLVRKQNGLAIAQRANPALPTLLGGTAPDAEFGIEGDSWGFGFNLGYMFELNEGTRFGVAYRSAIHHKNEGDAYLDAQALGQRIGTALAGVGYTPAQISALLGQFPTKADGEAKVKTPESLSVNGYHELNSRWAVMGDLTWTRHSRLQQLVVEAQPITTTYLQTKWNDTYRASVGASYRLNDQWKLRGGYMYDQSPTDSAHDVLPTMPDNDRQWLSFGASWQLSKRDSIDLAYSYIFIKDRSLDRYYDSATTPDVSAGSTIANLPTGGTTNGRVTGEFRSSAQIFGVQWNRSF